MKFLQDEDHSLNETLREIEARPQIEADSGAIIETRSWSYESGALLDSDWLASRDDAIRDSMVDMIEVRSAQILRHEKCLAHNCSVCAQKRVVVDIVNGMNNNIFHDHRVVRR